MKHTNDVRTEMQTAGVSARAGNRALQPWVRPRLVRVGSVAQVTAKIDNQGTNDGGTGAMKRT